MANMKNWVLNLKYKLFLIRRNYLTGLFCRDKVLKEEKKMDLGSHVRHVEWHGYGKNDKYKNKKGVICYSVLYNGTYHSFVKWPKRKYRAKWGVK